MMTIITIINVFSLVAGLKDLGSKLALTLPTGIINITITFILLHLIIINNKSTTTIFNILTRILIIIFIIIDMIIINIMITTGRPRPT